MATLARQLNLTNSAMALIVRAATDDELIALAGSEVCDFSSLSDDELNAVIDGTATADIASEFVRTMRR